MSTEILSGFPWRRVFCTAAFTVLAAILGWAFYSCAVGDAKQQQAEMDRYCAMERSLAHDKQDNLSMLADSRRQCFTEQH